MVVRVNGSTGIVTVSGTSGAPSLRGPDGNSGISFDGDQVIISSSGLVAATFSDSAATINNLSFSPGSSGTPTVAPSGDLNTGIYFPAADTIGFAEGGTEAGRFDSSGRFLVGATNSSANVRAVFQANSAGATGAGVVQIARGNTFTAASTNVGNLEFTDSDGNIFSRIQCESDAATVAGSDHPGRITFEVTASGAVSPSEQMRLTNTGDLRLNAGFGSVTPIYGVRGWARVDGDGTFSVYGSNGFDVITDQGTGLYRFNFENPMPDTNYSVAGSTDANTIFQVTNITATNWVQTNIQTTSATATDSDNTSIIVVR